MLISIIEHDAKISAKNEEIKRWQCLCLHLLLELVGDKQDGDWENTVAVAEHAMTEADIIVDDKYDYDRFKEKWEELQKEAGNG